MKILISGGGIAGLTAAYWLEKACMTPVVIEKAQGIRQTGYGLDFFGTGLDIAERMGILGPLRAHPLPAEYVAFVNAAGKQIASMHIAALERAAHDQYIPLMHYTLENVLYETIRDRVEVRFDTSIHSIQQSSDAVTVQYENGTQESFDLLVGADGIHSNVRGLIFGPESEFAHFMGYWVASYTLPDQYGLGKSWTSYGEPGRQCGVYPDTHPNEIVPFFFWKSEEQGVVPREKRLAKLRRVFAGMGWIVEKMLADTPDTTDIFMDTATQIRMPGWSRGRVVLIGDAAGCPTLLSGQGASLAMGGAFVLANELSRNADYRDALAYYEDRMRPQVAAQHKKARGLAKSFVPATRWGVLLQRLALRVLFRDALASVVVRELLGTSILQSEAFHRLPESHDALLGYRVAGKLEATDYERLRLDVDYQLGKAGQVRMLLQLDGINGIAPEAFWDDFEFGRDYRHAIAKLAIVGDSRLASWGTLFAERFYTGEVKHFAANALHEAWEWLATAREPQPA